MIDNLWNVKRSTRHFAWWGLIVPWPVTQQTRYSWLSILTLLGAIDKLSPRTYWNRKMWMTIENVQLSLQWRQLRLWYNDHNPEAMKRKKWHLKPKDRYKYTKGKNFIDESRIWAIWGDGCWGWDEYVHEWKYGYNGWKCWTKDYSLVGVENPVCFFFNDGVDGVCDFFSLPESGSHLKHLVHNAVAGEVEPQAQDC